MNRYNQAQPPTLEMMLTGQELSLLKDFDLLLSALSDGSLAKVGHVKKSSVTFKHPDRMFDELVRVAKSFQQNSC